MIRIGLVRHFKVNHQMPARFMNHVQFNEWVQHYDEAEIIRPANIQTIEWDLCFSSDMPRAVATANALCDCPITKTPLLREVPLSPFMKKTLKIPRPFWSAGGRLAWLASHASQTESIHETKARARKFIRLLEAAEKDNILIVSHGFFLPVLLKQLKEKGCAGKSKKRFANGELHILIKRKTHG